VIRERDIKLTTSSGETSDHSRPILHHVKLVHVPTGRKGEGEAETFEEAKRLAREQLDDALELKAEEDGLFV
jgi:hypothetical protein